MEAVSHQRESEHHRVPAALPEYFNSRHIITQSSQERKARNRERGDLASLLKAAGLPKVWDTKKGKPLWSLLGVKLEILL